LSVLWGFRRSGGPRIEIPQNGKVVRSRGDYSVERPEGQRPPPPPPPPPGDGLAGFLLFLVLVAGGVAVWALTRRVAVTVEQVSPPGMAETFFVGRGSSVALGGGEEAVAYQLEGVLSPIAYVIGQFPRRVEVRKASEDDVRTSVVPGPPGMSWRVEHRRQDSDSPIVVQIYRGLSRPASEPSRGD